MACSSSILIRLPYPTLARVVGHIIVERKARQISCQLLLLSVPPHPSRIMAERILYK
jgi:hypothetical protein